MSDKEVQKTTLPPWKSLLAGCAAGAIEGAVTYPFEFAKTMAQFAPDAKKLPLTAVPQTRNPFALVYRTAAQRGISALYVGCSTVIVGTSLKVAARFVAFDSISSVFKDENGKLSGGRAILAGTAAGVIESVFVVTPFETVKTALIEDAKRAQPRYRGMIHGSMSMVIEKGIGAIYRGVSSVTLRQVSVSAVRMMSYGSLKGIAKSRQSDPNAGLTPGATFGVGALAGVLTVYSTMPFDTVKTRMQSLSARSQYTSTFDCARKMLRNEGISAFWRGSTARLGRIVVGSSLFFFWIEKGSSS